MTNVQTIYPDIQTDIVDMLPDNGLTALKLMAQLSANMLVSVKGADIELFITELRNNFSEYKAQS